MFHTRVPAVVSSVSVMSKPTVAFELSRRDPKKPAEMPGVLSTCQMSQAYPLAPTLIFPTSGCACARNENQVTSDYYYCSQRWLPYRVYDITPLRQNPLYEVKLFWMTLRPNISHKSSMDII